MLPGCRRRRLLGGFLGPTVGERCGACDRCCPGHSLCLVSTHPKHEADVMAAATTLADWLAAGPPRTLAKACSTRVGPKPLPTAFRGRAARDTLLLLLLAHRVLELTPGGAVTHNQRVGLPPELHYAQVAIPSAPRGRPARSVVAEAVLAAEVEELRAERAVAREVIETACERERQIACTLLQREAQLQAVRDARATRSLAF